MHYMWTASETDKERKIVFNVSTSLNEMVEILPNRNYLQAIQDEFST